MQRLVCVGDVKASVQQGRCEVLAALPMSADREALVLWLIPRVCPALVVQPWLYFRCIISENRKRGHAVFPVIFELVIAPDHAEVGLKLIEHAARPTKAIDHRLTMLVGMRLTVVASPLPAHSVRPVVERTQAFG